jgi:ubiquinone/menaquinone biosynthesis C-methylase UbiE
MNNLLKQKIEEIIKDIDISPQSSVIDVGCADIRPYSQFLIEYFDKYTGVDLNNSFLTTAKQMENEKNKTEFQIGNIEKLNYKDKEFDVVVCNNMLAYTNKEVAINESMRVLRNGGVFISLNNNTIQYSIMKIFNNEKGLCKEFVHSIMVILNTILFRFTKQKIHRTTFNSKKEFKVIFENSKYGSEFLLLEKIKTNLPYSVINFVVRKKDGNMK